MNRLAQPKPNQEVYLDSRFRNVERESSQQVLRRAEISQAKSKMRSHSKYIFDNDDHLKAKRIKLIHQIEQKLAMKEQVNINQEEVNVTQLRGRVQRLQQLMGQIKREREYNLQPKTIFIREQTQRHPTKSNTLKVTSQSSDVYVESSHTSSLQMLLREIEGARREVRDIHAFNKRIASREKEQIRNQCEAVYQIHSDSPSGELKNKSPEVAPPRDSPESRQSRSRGVQKRQTLINELQFIPEVQLNSKACLDPSLSFNSTTVVRDIPNGQLYYPSEVLLTWNRDNEKGQLHQFGR